MRDNELVHPFGPQQVRALRNGRSRAEFARALGVTPLTVYRWELPDDAPQARRPRGVILERLQRFSAGAPSPLEPASEPPPPPEPPAPAAVEVELSRADELVLLPALDRAMHGDWRRAERELAAALAPGRLAGEPARALAAGALAELQLLQRSDAQAALATLRPALAAADAGRLPPVVESRVQAAAALVFAWTDGRLFDPRRVQGCAARVEELCPPGPAQARVGARIAACIAASALTDQTLLADALARLDDVVDTPLPPLLRCFVDEARGLQAWTGGQASLAARTFEAAAARAADAGYDCPHARSLAYLSSLQVDELGDPHAALQLARRARTLAAQAHAGPGLHLMIAANAEAEALLRLGQLDDAARLLDETERSLEEIAAPPVLLVVTRVRQLALAGRAQALAALAADLEERARRARGPRPGLGAASLGAYAAYARAFARQCAGEAPDAVVASLREAERLAADWAVVRREVVVALVPALVRAARLGEAQQAATEAAGFLDFFPSPWRAAVLRRHEGVLLLWQGRRTEGRQLLDAALGTFQRAQDLPEEALTRRALARLDGVEGVPGADAALGESAAELARLGIASSACPFLDGLPGVPRPADADPDEGPAPTLLSLLAPVRRLSVRGASLRLLRQELLAAVGSLFPGRAARLEEVSPDGAVRLLGGTAAEASACLEWFDLEGWPHRRLRLGIAGPLSQTARAAVATLLSVSELAGEVASLRENAAESGAAGDSAPELPGFVVASPALRRLRARLARLSASRAPALVTGEDGVGKEVVARALHALSARASGPYVVLDCRTDPATLQRRLFGAPRNGAPAEQGALRAAHQGTLYLRAVSRLPPQAQAALLRFLEAPGALDVRLVAGTGSDLAALVREGAFHPELLDRLQAVPLHVAPLRERREDIAALARRFMKGCVASGDPPVLSGDAIARLCAHPWPGNVRELNEVIERTMARVPVPAVVTAELLRF